MKNIFLLFAFVVLTGLSSYGQNFDGGIIFGGNLSQYDGDNSAGFKKLGVNTGIMAELPIADKFSISIEILYSQKGAIDNDIYNPLTPIKIKLNYVEVPLLANFHDKNKYVFGTGFLYGNLMSYSETLQGRDITDAKLEQMRDYAVDWVANFRLKTTSRFQFNFRYSYSVISPDKRKFTANNSASFRLIYSLVNQD